MTARSSKAPAEVGKQAGAWPRVAFLSGCRAFFGWLPTRVRRCLPGRDALLVLPECAVVLGVIAVIWICIGLMLSQQHDAAALAAERDTANLARAFEENTERIVAGIDQTLLTMRTDFTENPQAFDLADWQRRHLRADRLTVQLGFITPDGFANGSSIGGAAAARIDLSDREHYRFHLDPTRNELFISKPVLGRGTGRWTVQFTRKALFADGSFAGVPLLSMGCEELSRFYETLDIGKGTILLAGTDGIIRARAPLLDGTIGADIRNFPPEVLTGPHPDGHFSAHSRYDGLDRIFSYRRLPDLPLVVLVGFDTAQIFGSYWQARARSALFGCVVTVIVLIFGALWIGIQRRWIISRRLLRLTLENISQGIVMVDARGQTPVVNARAIELLGHPSETHGALPLLTWPPWAEEPPAGSGQPGPESPEALTRLVRKDGKIIEVQSHPTAAGGTVLTYTDVTERKLAEARILHLAHHDALTGLSNRLLLAERTAQAVDQARRQGGNIAVLCLDIDGFKAVNDTMGHDAGDVVLVRFAERLRSLIRPSDAVARTGGDEFIVLVRDLAEPCLAEEIARRLQEDLPIPVDLGGYVMTISTSIGVAIYPQDGTDGPSLLKNADTALYRAKTESKGGYRRFESWMDYSLAERRALEHDLRDALEHGQFEILYQPQFSCRTLAVVGFEALLRWHHPERGNVPPDVFIPLAEECALIVPIGRMVLEQACAAAAAWQPSCRLAVNLSPIQFRDDNLVAEVSAILRQTGLPPGMLELEVTEGVLIRDGEQALCTLRGLKALGTNIALDDFGTGYSSLSYLRRFPFDRIKVDRSFVQAQEEDIDARAIVEAVLAMCNRLNLQVTAEGVETETQLDLLRQQGCAEVQGYLLGRPIAGAEVQDFLAFPRRAWRNDYRRLTLVATPSEAAEQESLGQLARDLRAKLRAI